MGHVVSKDGNVVHPKKIEAIVQWERPTNVRQIRNLLGFDDYCHRFIVRFSALSEPLTAPTWKNAPNFSREQYEASVLELKQSLMSTHVLT